MTDEQESLFQIYLEQSMRAEKLKSQPEANSARWRAREAMTKLSLSRKEYGELTREDLQKRQDFVDRVRGLVHSMGTVCVKLPDGSCDCCLARTQLERVLYSSELFLAMAKHQLFGEPIVFPVREFEKEVAK